MRADATFSPDGDVHVEVTKYDEGDTYMFEVATGNCPECQVPYSEHMAMSIYCTGSGQSEVLCWCCCGAIYIIHPGRKEILRRQAMP